MNRSDITLGTTTAFLNKGWTKSLYQHSTGCYWSWENVGTVDRCPGSRQRIVCTDKQCSNFKFQLLLYHALIKQDNINGHVKLNTDIAAKLNKFYPCPLKIQITKFGAFILRHRVYFQCSVSTHFGSVHLQMIRGILLQCCMLIVHLEKHWLQPQQPTFTVYYFIFTIWNQILC